MNYQYSSHSPTQSIHPALVTSPEQFDEVLGVLAAQDVVAVDTESNSLYVYKEQVCLIQFSTVEQDYLVDPLAGLDLAPLADIFSSPKITKVFHAAEYDVMCLKRDFGFSFANLFDTMWAARILGWPRFGLGDILLKEFGVHTNKRYQRYNWGLRPLKPDAVTYASLDTHYLLPLEQIQAKALKSNGRCEEAQEVFAQVAAVEGASSTFDPQGFWRIKGLRNLTGGDLAILSALYVWRDQEAQRRGQPPFKILGNRTLVNLAQAHPLTLGELERTSLLKSHLVRRYGRSVLRAIRSGRESPSLSPPPRPTRRSRDEVTRFERLRAWRKKTAAVRGVEPDVVLGNTALWKIAELNPRTMEDWKRVDGIGPWKRRAYGKAVLEVLNRAGGSST